MLIVEDNHDLGMIYRIAFEGLDFVVENSYDGDEGIKKALSFKPDLVILDVAIPKKNGFEVLKSVHDKLPTALFVMNSGVYSEDLLRKNAITYDRVECLDKPLRIEHMIEAVMMFFRRYKKI